MKKTTSVKRTAIKPDIAFERLQRAILSGELKEGDVVREKRLAIEWGIGRTPMRQAIQRAAESGYLVLKPNKSATVREFTLKDIQQIYSLREILESLALESAWPQLSKADIAHLHKLQKAVLSLENAQERLDAQFRLDHELHNLWIQKSGNPWLISALERLLIYRPNLTAMLNDHPKLAERAFRDHGDIIAAMENDDLKQAKVLLRKHIQRSWQMISKSSVAAPASPQTASRKRKAPARAISTE